MRALFEILFAALLIGLAWDTSYSEKFSNLLPRKEKSVSAPPSAQARSPQPAQSVSRAPSATSNGAWMWDPHHQTALDRPAYNPRDPKMDPRWHKDEQGRAYWVDAIGQRHYEP